MILIQKIFFSWEVYTPGERNVPFLQRLPVLNEVLNTINNKFKKELDDFIKVEKMIEIANKELNEDKSDILLTEIEHYLGIAFSKYQIEFDKCDIKNWAWTQWFNENKSDIKFCLSFNYDLILESILEYCNRKFRRIGIHNEKEGVLILKPHGSIDFEISDKDISMGPITYPLSNILRENNASIKSLKKDKLLSPRKEVDIVLPNDYSSQLNYQWVKPGYECIAREGENFTDFIIIGHSYSKYDREEVDFVLNNLTKDTNIIIADTNPKIDLINKLKKENFQYVKLCMDPPYKL